MQALQQLSAVHPPGQHLAVGKTADQGLTVRRKNELDIANIVIDPAAAQTAQKLAVGCFPDANIPAQDNPGHLGSVRREGQAEGEIAVQRQGDFCFQFAIRDVPDDDARRIGAARRQPLPVG